jgi:hypothetical protein
MTAQKHQVLPATITRTINQFAEVTLLLFLLLNVSLFKVNSHKTDRAQDIGGGTLGIDELVLVPDVR